MDPLSGSRFLYTPSEIEVPSGRAFGHRIGRGRHLGELPILYAICGGWRGVIRNRFLVFQGGKHFLCGLLLWAPLPVKYGSNSGPGNVGEWLRARNGFRQGQRRHN